MRRGREGASTAAMPSRPSRGLRVLCDKLLVLLQRDRGGADDVLPGFGISRAAPLDLLGVGELRAAIGDRVRVQGQPMQPVDAARQVPALRDDARLYAVLEKPVEVELGQTRAAAAVEP